MKLINPEILRPEKIYFHETAWKYRGNLLPAIKVGHTTDIIDRSGKFRTIIPTFPMLYAFEVPDQILLEEHFTSKVSTHKLAKEFNKELAYELEQRILLKYIHLNVAPHIKDCEVVKDDKEVRGFISSLKKVDRNKILSIRKAALNNLFTDSLSMPLEIDGKTTKYFIDLVAGHISSSTKMKEPDCEGRIQLNLDPKVFGQFKKMLNKKAREDLLAEHLLRYGQLKLRK